MNHLYTSVPAYYPTLDFNNPSQYQIIEKETGLPWMTGLTRLEALNMTKILNTPDIVEFVA